MMDNLIPILCIVGMTLLIFGGATLASWIIVRIEEKEYSTCRRGLVQADIEATNIFTGRVRDYSSGYHEVWIIEETANLYNVRWKNDRFQQSDSIPKWIPKSECKVIEEEREGKYE